MRSRRALLSPLCASRTCRSGANVVQTLGCALQGLFHPPVSRRPVNQDPIDGLLQQRERQRQANDLCAGPIRATSSGKGIMSAMPGSDPDESLCDDLQRVHCWKIQGPEQPAAAARSDRCEGFIAEAVVRGISSYVTWKGNSPPSKMYTSRPAPR